MRNHKLVIGIATVLAAASTSGVAAKPPTIKEQIEALQKTLADQQAEIETQKQQIEEQQGELRALRNSIPTEDKKDTAVADLQNDVKNRSQASDNAKFIGRASSSELSRSLGGADGRLGLGVRGSAARWFAAATLTSRTVNDAEVFDSQTAVGARYGIRFRDRPELRVDSTRLIDTGTINADDAYAAGVELAGNWRNFYLQGEDYWFGIERAKPTTLSNPNFSGYYVQGSWVITGEPHRYNMATASYQAPRLPLRRCAAENRTS